MSGRFSKFCRQRACSNKWPDPRHHQGDCRQHLAAEFSKACCRPRVFKVHARRRVHPVGKDSRVGMTLCDDGDVFPADTEGMKRPRGLGGRRRV